MNKLKFRLLFILMAVLAIPVANAEENYTPQEKQIIKSVKELFKGKGHYSKDYAWYRNTADELAKSKPEAAPFNFGLPTDKNQKGPKQELSFSNFRHGDRNSVVTVKYLDANALPALLTYS